MANTTCIYVCDWNRVTVGTLGKRSKTCVLVRSRTLHGVSLDVQSGSSARPVPDYLDIFVVVRGSTHTSRFACGCPNILILIKLRRHWQL